MTQISVIDDVITGLLAVLGAALAVPVLDGLEVTAADFKDFAIVGHDGSATNADGKAATTTQQYSSFELGSRDERGSITCAVISQSGDDDLPARRAASKATMVAVETALRATETLGGAVATGYISSIDLYQQRNSAGCMVRRVFVFEFMGFQD